MHPFRLTISIRVLECIEMRKVRHVEPRKRVGLRKLVLGLALAAQGLWGLSEPMSHFVRTEQRLKDLRYRSTEVIRQGCGGMPGAIAQEVLSDPNVRTVLLVGTPNRSHFFFLSYYLLPVRLLFGPRDLPVYGEQDLAQASLRLTLHDNQLVLTDPEAKPSTPPIHRVATDKGAILHVDESTYRFMKRERVGAVVVILGSRVALLRISDVFGNLS